MTSDHARQAPNDVARSPGGDVVAVVVLPPDQSALTEDSKAAIRSVLAQTVLPGAVLVVSTGPTPLRGLEDSDIDGASMRQVHAPKAKNLGQAVAAALATHKGRQECRWIWVVHDDMVAEPDALGRMLESGRISLSVGAVGPKQVDYDDPERILEIGIKATRTARRTELVEPDEIDQGQHDDVEDVLAVGTAGMLIRKSAWDTVGGFDPSLGPFGDGLEFGRRLWRSGFRVIAEPKAVVRHRQTSYSHDSRGIRSFGGRRGAQLYNWVLTVPTLLLFPLMVWLPIWSVVRSGGRLLTRQPRLAVAEIYAYGTVVKRTPGAFRQRRKIAAVATVPKATLGKLEVQPGVISGGKRHRKKVLTRGQTDAVALDTAALATYRRHRYVSAGTLAALVLVTIVVSIFLWSPFRAGIQGGSWGLLPDSWLTLVDQAWSGWQVSGDGAVGPAATELLPLTLLSAPFALVGMVPSTFSMALLFSALPLAVLGGWLAASVFTRSVAVRAALAATWSATGVAWVALAAGNLGIVMAYLALPVLFVGLWRGFRRIPSIRAESVDDVVFVDQPDRFAWLGLAGLALLVIAPSSPVMVVIALLAAVLMASLPLEHDPYVKAQPLGALAKVAGVAVVIIPSCVWMTPAFLARVAGALSGGLVRDGAGGVYSATDFWDWFLGAQLAGGAPTWWQFLSGYSSDPSLFGPSGGGAWPLVWLILALSSGAWLVLWAVGALAYRSFRPGSARRWTRTSVFFLSALLFWVVALIEPAGTGYPAILVAAGSLSLIWAVATALPKVRLRGIRSPADMSSQKSAGVRGTLAGLALVAASATLAAGAVLGGVGPFSSMLHQQDQGDSVRGSTLAIEPTAESGFPLTGKEAQTGPRAARVLALSAEGGSVNATVLRGPGLQLSDILSGAPEVESENASAVETSQIDLATAVGGLVTGMSDNPAQVLSEHAVDIILLDPGTENYDEYANQFDATEGLERIGSVDAGTMWRVRWEGAAPSRVTLRDDAGQVDIIDSGPVNVEQKVLVDSPKVLVLAETADPYWVARFQGTVLSTVSDDRFPWQQTWQVPEGEGKLTIRYQPPYLGWWNAVSGLAVLALVSSAIPWRYRRPERVRVQGDADA